MSQVEVLRWEDPPAAAHPDRKGYRRSRLERVAEQLRERPGEWAVVLDGEASRGKASGMTFHIRLGQIACFTPSGDFDAVMRRVEDRFTVYARYVGDEVA